MPVSVETLVPGDGVTYPKTGERVDVFYDGMLKNGVIFDSSCKRGKDRPFVFNIGLGQVMKGWEEGVMKMSLGEKARITIPAELGYGAKEFQNENGESIIPPNSDLIYEITLLRIWPLDGGGPKICQKLKDERSLQMLYVECITCGCSLM